MTWYPLDHVCCVETGMVLLYSWLTINGVDSSGQRNVSIFKFNLATENLFALFVESMRSAVAVAYILILTDSELILIREEETQRLTRNSRYGGVWNYISLR